MSAPTPLPPVEPREFHLVINVEAPDRATAEDRMERAAFFLGKFPDITLGAMTVKDGDGLFPAAVSRDEGESVGTRVGRELRISHLERTIELLTAQLTAARAAESEAVRALAAARERIAFLEAQLGIGRTEVADF